MPTSLSILYLGPHAGTCLDRANALRRLGHHVEQIDLRQLLPKTSWVDRVIWRLGGYIFAPMLMQKLTKKIHEMRFSKQLFDLCYVDGGELVTPKVIALLRHYSKKVINYNIDDPFGCRDGRRYNAYRKSQPNYDLSVVMRNINVQEAKNFGAKNVLRVFMSADELTHEPRKVTPHDHKIWDSEVLFLGTWFPERGSFLVQLIQLGIPVTIRGANWYKSPEWPQLKRYWKGGNLSGDDYAKAIQCAKVNIGLLSKENRDLHTTRSLEIPALGGLLCAERTSEHLEMYIEGFEALFWKDAEECAEMCRLALNDEERRIKIAKAGHQRIKNNKHYNETILTEILALTGLLS